MKIAVTGGTGYLGSALLTRLIADGHSVTALVRSEAAADTIVGRGPEPVIGDLFDQAWAAEQFAAADAVVHTAATGDADTERLDRSVAAAAVQALSGTAKPYVHTGGVWIYGAGVDITEESPLRPPALTAWRGPVEEIVLTADLTATVVVPGVVYGYGAGIPAALFGPRDDAGRVRLVGGGEQHWATVHVDDLAALYALVVERGEGLGRLIGVGGDNPTVREIGQAAAGAGEVVAETADESRERLGAAYADALLLDQQASGARARSLGWAPAATTLVEEFRNGSYAA